jgi:virulence-associated protein VagC
MLKKMNVKVIKKDDKKAIQPAAKPRDRSKQTAREMVSTVSNWVNDFQQRKRDETKIAIEKFFVPGPRPSES